MESIIPTIFLVLYLIVMIVIGYLPKIKTSINLEDYFVAGRTFSYLVLYMTVAATVYSGFALMGTPGLWITKGVGSFFVFTYIVFAYVILFLVGPRVWEIGKERGYVTQADIIGDRFQSDFLRVLSAAVGFLMMFPYIAAGLVACAYTVNIITYGKVSYPVAALVVTVVAAIYIWAGGIKAVAWTDVVQGFIMLFALIGTGFLVLYHYFPDSTALFDAVIVKGPEKLAFDKGYSWPMYTSMVLMMMWGFISWPQIFVRAYAAKSKKVIRLTSALGPIGAFIAYVPMMIAAFAIFSASNQTFPAPDKALLTELGQYAPIWFFGIVGVGVLASAMSTFDSQAHMAGVILAKDLFQRIFKMKDEKKILQYCKIVIAIGLLASYLMALKPPKLMWDILISSYAGVSQLVPPLIAALYWKRATREGATAGLIAGLIIALLFSYVWVHPLQIHAGLWGMVINTVFLIVISYGSKRPSEEILRAFYK